LCDLFRAGGALIEADWRRPEEQQNRDRDDGLAEPTSVDPTATDTGYRPHTEEGGGWLR
jgi:hypothetical protein